jgi:hypothetical protein
VPDPRTANKQKGLNNFPLEAQLAVLPSEKWTKKLDQSSGGGKTQILNAK